MSGGDMNIEMLIELSTIGMQDIEDINFNSVFVLTAV